MVRVGGLFRALEANVEGIDPSGRTTRQQLDEIAEKVRVLVAEQYVCIREEVLPGLRGAGIFIHSLEELDKNEGKRLDEYFETQVFPVLTPLAVDAGHPFPFLGNLRLNLMAVFREASGIKIPQAYAFVEVPSILPRLIPVNASRGDSITSSWKSSSASTSTCSFRGSRSRTSWPSGSPETKITTCTKTKSWTWLNRWRRRSRTVPTRSPSDWRWSPALHGR